ncbi:IS1 family transposase [Methylomonas sp. AM2-LC]|uniref:IS1 family transposase n=1 Tax=Methylomonas sp. AM2-LC TaxID=3153301 RepID=UPI00326335FA
MNKLNTKDRAKILSVLCEGMGINAASRVTGASKNTILKLLADAGEACAIYQDENHHNLKLKRIECDEICSFVGMKQKNVPEEMKGLFGIGDVYTWTAIDADTKLVPCWHVGTRDAGSANCFINDLASRLSNRVQLTSDGHKAYLNAVEDAFGANVDFAQLIKLYGNGGNAKDDTRYSPAECTGIEKRRIEGNPDFYYVSTSYVERQNLTMRMRRFTRLTNTFSKKLENHMHALSLYFMFYNYCKIHKSLRITPAMAAGLTDHVWELTDIVNLITEPEPKKRGPYKKKAD